MLIRDSKIESIGDGARGQMESPRVWTGSKQNGQITNLKWCRWKISHVTGNRTVVFFFCIISHSLLVCCPFEDPLDVQRAPLPLMASRMIVESLVNAKLEGKSLRSKPLWLKETESSFCWWLWFQPWKCVSHESVNFCPNWNISTAMGWIMTKLCTDIDISGVPRRLITSECCGCSVFLRESAGAWVDGLSCVNFDQTEEHVIHLWHMCNTAHNKPPS